MNSLGSSVYAVIYSHLYLFPPQSSASLGLSLALQEQGGLFESKRGANTPRIALNQEGMGVG